MGETGEVMESLTELKETLRNAIFRESRAEGICALKEFRDNGGEQQLAYVTLENLLLELPVHEDLITDFMDVASGWCDKRAEIWHYNLGDRVRLVCVESLLELEDCVQVFPVVPADLVRKFRLSWVEKGTPVELKHKEETKHTSIVRLISSQTGFYVTVPKELDVRKGTELWVETDWLVKENAARSSGV